MSIITTVKATVTGKTIHILISNLISRYKPIAALKKADKIRTKDLHKAVRVSFEIEKIREE